MRIEEEGDRLLLHVEGRTVRFALYAGGVLHRVEGELPEGVRAATALCEHCRERGRRVLSYDDTACAAFNKAL